MKRLVLLSWLLVLLLNSETFSQSNEENKKNFNYAESQILFEDYEEALPFYLQLLKIYPENSNFKFRIGQCYLNIIGEKEKAISYLEDAVKNINPEYNKGKFGETGAPYDALYFLGSAYRINNQLDKAIEAYKIFRKNINPEVFDTNIVDLQIQSCLNAKKQMSLPLYIHENNIGSTINQGNSEFNPVVSDKEDLLVFSRTQPFYDAILYSTKTSGKWSVPKNMNELLKVDQELYPTSLSKDGKDLYLYSSADYDGNIFTSRFENGNWSKIVKLNGNINTKYWESHATISGDNKKLYFTSNRKGSLGGLDIYVSIRDSNGDWGPALNLGPVINTPYNEESPFLSQDDRTLFFSSRGHFNIGGYDIFSSTLLNNGDWSAPLNLGYPLNTTDDDVFFKPLNDGYEGYIAKDISGGFGKQDIYKVEMFSDSHPRMFYVRGMAKIADLMSNLKDSVKMSITNLKNFSQKLIAYTDPKTDKFEFQLTQGNYQITYEADGGEKVVKNFTIPVTYPSDSFELPLTILPKTEVIAALSDDRDKNIPDIKSEALVVPVKAEPPPPAYAGPRAGINQVTADNQIAALIAALRNRANDKLLKVIDESDLNSRQFGRPDDVITYLKEEASRKSIDPEEMDKLALRVAILDNILTQAAVDLLEKYSDGELKSILSGLDIYKEGLKTWTDLLEYILAKSGGRIRPEDINRIAASILTDIDTSILKLREKVLIFSKTYKDSVIVRRSVDILDFSNIKLREKWLMAFYNESFKQGLTLNQMAEMLAMMSALPDTGVEQFLRDLIEQSEEPLLTSLRSVDLKKEKIKSAKDMIKFLLTSKDKEKYPEEAVFKTIADLIIAKDIPADIITSQLTTGKNYKLWILWFVIGAGLIFFFIIFRKRRRKTQN